MSANAFSESPVDSAAAEWTALEAMFPVICTAARRRLRGEGGIGSNVWVEATVAKLKSMIGPGAIPSQQHVVEKIAHALRLTESAIATLDDAVREPRADDE